MFEVNAQAKTKDGGKKSNNKRDLYFLCKETDIS